MSNTGVPIPASLPPSPPRVCRGGAGVEACFYPGFVRRLAVDQGGVETVLYDQRENPDLNPFVLPPGQTLPWPTSALELRANGRGVTLQISDPGQQIERIEVVLKPGVPGEPPLRVIAEDHPILCPPICPE